MAHRFLHKEHDCERRRDALSRFALKVANERNCNCGCQNDTIAKCRTQDPSCGTAPQLLASIIGDLDSIRGRKEPNAAMWAIELALRSAVHSLG